MQINAEQTKQEMQAKQVKEAYAVTNYTFLARMAFWKCRIGQLIQFNKMIKTLFDYLSMD